jgi:chorismate synthase
MHGNTFGRAFKIMTFGESHQKAVGVVIDGCPAGLPVKESDIQPELDKRRPGQSHLTTQRSEADKVEILSGVFEGKTTGSPIAMIVMNADVDPSSYEEIKDLARPGHADLGYQAKYGFRDYRGGGRSSGRETVGRVAAGAIAKKLLSLKGIHVYAHVRSIFDVTAKEVTIDDIINNTYSNPVRCADAGSVKRMEDAIVKAKQEGDSVGGIVEAIAIGVPAGIGSPVFGKLDADIAGALMGIGAVKGVEIGAGFNASRMMGSTMNDSLIIENGEIKALTNNSGGIAGGISTGMPIVCRVAVKPTPSVSITQKTVNMKTMENASILIKGRHDPSIVPRIVPVVEAMISLVLADHMIISGKISPDSVI